ncbi:hypothetical protein AB4212_29545, partial [Streptomyces sp. 2MCAF27]
GYERRRKKEEIRDLKERAAEAEQIARNLRYRQAGGPDVSRGGGNPVVDDARRFTQQNLENERNRRQARLFRDEDEDKDFRD